MRVAAHSLRGSNRVGYSLKLVARRSVDSLDFVGGGSHNRLDFIVGKRVGGLRFVARRSVVSLDFVYASSHDGLQGW
jgi:hypothetical protein